MLISHRVIAHRGASALAPENTFVAFVKAVQMGAKWVEFDVMQAATGELVIIHDEYLERTTNGVGEVCQSSYDYLKTLDAGSWFSPEFSEERIPLLAPVLDFLKERHVSANIELKPMPGKEEAFIQRLMQMPEMVDEASPSYLYSSFSIPVLEELRRQAPNVNIGLLMHDFIPEWRAISDRLQCATVNINVEILTPELAAEVKSTGRALLCYTVNQPDRAKELISWGVDAVFSDFPNLI